MNWQEDYEHYLTGRERAEKLSVSLVTDLLEKAADAFRGTDPFAYFRYLSPEFTSRGLKKGVFRIKTVTRTRVSYDLIIAGAMLAGKTVDYTQKIEEIELLGNKKARVRLKCRSSFSLFGVDSWIEEVTVGLYKEIPVITEANNEVVST